MEHFVYLITGFLLPILYLLLKFPLSPAISSICFHDDIFNFFLATAAHCSFCLAWSYISSLWYIHEMYTFLPNTGLFLFQCLQLLAALFQLDFLKFGIPVSTSPSFPWAFCLNCGSHSLTLQVRSLESENYWFTVSSQIFHFVFCSLLDCSSFPKHLAYSLADFFSLQGSDYGLYLSELSHLYSFDIFYPSTRILF